MTQINPAISYPAQQETKEGFETYQFDITKAFFDSVEAKLSDLKFRLANFYPFSRRPSVDEIKDVNISSSTKEGMVSVTLIIKRGHWEIAEFIHEHSKHVDIDMLIYADIFRVVCSNCGEKLELDIESIP